MDWHRRKPWSENPGFLLSRLAARMEALFEAELEQEQISRMHWLILRALHERESRPAVLAQELSSDRAAISRSLEALEQRGMVQRTGALTDRRGVQVTLTDQGRVLTRNLIQRSQEINARFFNGIDEEVREVFLETLRTVLDRSENLEESA
jgi:DNA-binding MarR family transcriptional regulator